MSLLLTVGLLALAQTTGAATIAEEPKKTERKICKTQEPETGSRMKIRRCLTQTEWETLDKSKERPKDDLPLR